jgi:hypothetical protein
MPTLALAPAIHAFRTRDFSPPPGARLKAMIEAAIPSIRPELFLLQWTVFSF